MNCAEIGLTMRIIEIGVASMCQKCIVVIVPNIVQMHRLSVCQKRVFMFAMCQNSHQLTVVNLPNFLLYVVNLPNLSWSVHGAKKALIKPP